MIGINIAGHVYSTVYYRNGRQWVSLEGTEIEVFEYHPSISQPPPKVVLRNQLYYIVNEAPTSGVYSGKDIMERISHDISVFWTKLSSLVGHVQFSSDHDVKQYWELSDMMINLAHTCASEIEQERSKSRSYLLEAESSQCEVNKLNQELKARSDKVDELQRKSDSFSKALKCSFAHVSKDSPPLLHQLCRDKAVSVTEIVKELKLDIRKKAYVRIPGLNVAHFTPLEMASYYGNASVMQELYDLDHSVVNALSLELSAHGSLACFELRKKWSAPSYLSLQADNLLGMHSHILTMAAEGGNSDILRSLIPLPHLFSASKHQVFWKGLVKDACIGGDSASLDWLMEFDGSKAILTDDFCRDKLLLSSGYKFGLPCVKWLVKHCFPPKLLFEPKMDKFQHDLARTGRIDILEWISTLKGFILARPGKGGNTMFHYACEAGSVSVMQWAHKYPEQDFDQRNSNGEHAVHLAAKYGRLDCLKWICENIPAFQHRVGTNHLLSITGRNKNTIVHYAASSGSVPTMEWLHSVHGADFKDLDDSGSLPIHHAYSSVKMLKWMKNVGKCDLKARDSRGKQILHLAVDDEEHDVVSYLLREPDLYRLDPSVFISSLK